MVDSLWIGFSLEGGYAMVGIWEAALGSMERRVHRHYFEMWFRPIRCTAVEGNRLFLLAPNRYIKEWFEGNYLDAVLSEIRTQTQTEYQVEFAIAEEAPAGGIELQVAPQTSQPLPPPVESHPELLVKYTFDSFVVGPSNQLAHAAARAVADVPAAKYNPLFIYGGVGLGKTHLIHAIGHQIHANKPNWKILYLKTEAFMNEYVSAIRNNHIDSFRRKYREECDVLLMDDIQFLAGKDRTQEEFFHTFNSLFESYRQIVVTADTYPHEIPHLEDRIRSRFQWGLIADIQPPELETRIAILEKKAEIDHLDLPKEVAVYLATHIKSNVRELEGLLIRVAAFASLQSHPITVEFARETLRDFLTQATHSLTVEAVQKEVAAYYDVKVADLKSPRRHQAVARPRQIAMYLARKLVKASYPELGQRFGGKDHTTVLSACRKMEKLMTDDPQTRHELQEIERHLTQ